MSFKHKLKINEKRYAIQILSIKIISICLQLEYFITCTYPINVYYIPVIYPPGSIWGDFSVFNVWVSFDP